MTNPQPHDLPLEKPAVSLDPTVVPDLAPYHGRAHKPMGSGSDAIDRYVLPRAP